MNLLFISLSDLHLGDEKYILNRQASFHISRNGFSALTNPIFGVVCNFLKLLNT